MSLTWVLPVLASLAWHMMSLCLLFLGTEDLGDGIVDSRYLPNVPLPLPMVIECGYVRVYAPNKHPHFKSKTFFSWSRYKLTYISHPAVLPIKFPIIYLGNKRNL